MKTSAEAPHPFDLDADAGLTLDGLALEELSAALEGRAVWLLSRRALEERLAEVGCVAVGAIGPLDVLAMAAGAGCWVTVRSSHELRLAQQAGFAAERVRAEGRVKEDGFVKDALALGVAVIACQGDIERANVERIAGFLGVSVPPASGGPAEATAADLQGVGALLAPVLAGSPDVAVDAPLGRGGALGVSAQHVFPLRPGTALDGTLAGLSQCSDGDGRVPACVHGDVARGAWVVVPSAEALVVRTPGSAHPEPPWVLVSDGRWRDLAPRAAPETDPLGD